MQKIVSYAFFLPLLALLAACTPEQDTAPALPDPPVAAFDVKTTSNPNKVLLQSTSAGAFLYSWDLGNGSKAESASVEAYYPFKGTYKVVLQAFGKGGYTSATKDVVITQNDPAACSGNMQLLTDCSKKIWKLDPNAGALKVGPDAAFSTVWWQNSTGDVAARSCHFNDEYIFDITGGFEYDNKGDFWADTDGNGNITPPDLGLTPGCQSATAWPAKYSAWNSGKHKFSLAGDNLTVTGNGAWIGLYKVGNGAEVTTPQSSITYKIKELTANRMVLLISFGPGFWQFTLVPK